MAVKPSETEPIENRWEVPRLALASACAGEQASCLIHPDQIGPANAAFSPSAEELEAAHRLIAAFARPENRGKGAIALDGHMVERLHETIARRTIALSQAIAALCA